MKVKKLFGGLQTDYLDGFQYKFTYAWEDETGTMTTDGMKLRIIPTPEGYFDGLRNRYFYNYTDHLGNIRLSYSDADANGEVTGDIVVNNCYDTPDGQVCNNYIIPGEAEGANNYYPFGLMHNAQANNFNNAYQYKYQGQELQETGFYSFKWRNYMPDVGRFFNIDPLSEKYAYQSHYNFSENRVIDGRELEGLEWSGIHYKNTDGSERIDNSAHFKVLNSSSKMTNNEAKIRTNQIMKQTEATYSGTDSQGIVKTLSTTVEYVDEVNPLTDYYIEFVDKIEGRTSPLVLGRVDEIGNSQSNRIQVLAFLGSGTDEVGTHEVGHTIGLMHGKDPNNSPEIVNSMTYDNIMNDGSKITPLQLNEIQKSIPTTIKIQTDENNYITPLSNE